MSRPFSSRDYTGGYQSAQLISGLLQGASIAHGSQTQLNLSGDFTIEGCLKMRSLPGSGASYTIVSKYYGAGNQRSYAFQLFNNSGTQTLVVKISQNGTSFDRVKRDLTLPIGVWSHVAVTCTVANAATTEFEFFLNGVSISNGNVLDDASVTGIFFNSTAPFEVGLSESGSYFDGWIDELRVWDDVRLVTEIRDNAFTELVGDEANLVGYWKLNGDFQDSTANANHLIAAGTVLPVFKKDGGIDS